MDKLISIGILFGITFIGLLSNFLKLGDIWSKFEFTANYQNKFNNFLVELFNKRSFNEQLYYELNRKVKEMQCELGSDGIYAYFCDNLAGYESKNYQALANFLPMTRNVLNDFDNSINRIRYIKEAEYCNDAFVRHLRSLELAEKNIKNSICNPLADFAEGVKQIVSLPILLLKWFGFISEERSIEIKKNPNLKIINSIITAVGFVSGIMAIIMGWNDFWILINSFFK